MERVSTFALVGFNHLDLVVLRCKNIPFHVGHAFFELPKTLKNKKALINIQNTDSRCFLYAILSTLHYNDIAPGTHNRPQSYEPYMHELNTSDISMPFQIGDLERFHWQNHTLTTASNHSQYPFGGKGKRIPLRRNTKSGSAPQQSQ